MNRGILDRFYRGECSQEEVQEVLRWFRENNLDAQHEQELHALWQQAGQAKAEEEPEHDPGSVFSKIKAQLQEPQQPEQEVTGPVNRFLQQPQFWLKVAAAVFLPLCLAIVLVQYTSRPKATAAVYRSVAAAPGVRKTVQLPDGSVVMLNAGSTITFRRDFVADKREIELHGEAFFKVAKDSLRPFIVHTGSISTQALGTSFNINYSSYNDAITVALATGVVKVEKQEPGQQRQLTMLAPGQQLSYSRTSEQHEVTSFNEQEVLGWREGKLYFRKADMNQVIRKLENWYGVDIEVDTRGKENEAWNYTGEYDDEALEKVLEGIGFVKGFSYKQTDGKVKIVFN